MRRLALALAALLGLTGAAFAQSSSYQGKADAATRSTFKDAAGDTVTEAVYNIATGTCASWCTLETITPLSAPAGVYGSVVVEATLQGTDTIGSQGVRFTRWSADTINGSQYSALSIIGTDVVKTITGTGAPEFRLQISGAKILVQFQSPGGLNNMLFGYARVKVTLPGYNGWTF